MLEQDAQQMRLRLQASGPMYSCFGLYCASRIDLLPVEICRELENIPDSTPAIPPAHVQQIIAGDLGSKWEQAFSEFDYVPHQSRLISQSHRARLRTGALVDVVILRPECYALHQSERAQAVHENVIMDVCGPWAGKGLLADFNAVLRRKTDLAAMREAMEVMAGDAVTFELLRSRKTHAELSTRKLLTVEVIEEQQLDQLAREQRGGHALAARLCHVWLRQALRGHCFPVGPQLHDIAVTDANQISFTNCEMAGLRSSVQENLWNYLDAMLADDPDRASAYLLREMEFSKSRSPDLDNFRSCFRQAAYFGMLEPVLGTDSNTMAQIVFQHWKAAQDHGYAPKPHLLCFYRGVFAIARIAYKLSPAEDHLREALMELRMTNAFDQVRTITDWRHWYNNADAFASALLNLPPAFDSLISRSAPEPTSPSQSGLQAAPENQNAFLTAVFCLFVLGLLQLLHLGASEKIVVPSLILTGLLLLRRLNRRY